jgi:DNA polymerase III alpha subunit (gram-positive type)
MTAAGAGEVTYVVTDIECDGPNPNRNSMLSFASVAVSATGEILGEFEAVLEPRPDRNPDPGTMAWWQSLPDVWAAATTNPEPPGLVMERFAVWVESLPGLRVFAARPLIFDGTWIDHYLDHYLGSRANVGIRLDRKVFNGFAALDLDSLIAGLMGAPHRVAYRPDVPEAWLGDHAHTHRAIDDARGYASLLQHLLALARARG